MISSIKNLCGATLHMFKGGKTLDELEPDTQQEWQEIFRGINVGYNKYRSSIGSLIFESVLDQVSNEDETDKNEDGFMRALKDKFFRLEDKRCEIGQVLSHTKKNGYYRRKRFEENANSVVLILAKDKTTLPIPDANDELVLESKVCSELLDFRSFDPSYAGKKLCHSFFYHDELIPNCSIFGSGCFIAPNRILTAAHVLEAIADLKTNPDDLLFIRGYWAYNGKDMKEIRINKDQIYVLNQKELIENEHIIYGKTGDIAWLQVKPLYHSSGMNDAAGYTGKLNIVSGQDPAPPKIGNPTYAVGHGLGVCMKLSFGSSVEFTDPLGWMGGDMDVFPGNSGSPIFHSNTHELIGVVSGANGLAINIQADIPLESNCISIKIEKDGVLTVINSQYRSIIKTFPMP